MEKFSLWKRGFRGHLLALVAGAIFPLGFAPIGWWPLTVISLMLFAPLLAPEANHSTFKSTRPLLRGWLYGFGFYSVGVSWVYVSIHTYGDASPLLAAALTAAFTAALALFFALFAWSYQKLGLYRLSWLGFPAWWVLFEWLKSWIFSGFPWLYAGNAFIDTPMEGFAPVIGVLGISWLIVLSAMLLNRLLGAFCQLADSARSKAGDRVSCLIALMLILGSAFTLQNIEWVKPDNEKSLQIAIVQANIPQHKKWDPSARSYILDTYRDNTDNNWDKDIIIWPEAALPVFFQEATDFIQPIEQRALETNTALISGTAYWQQQQDERYLYFNSIFSTGIGSGVYHKQRLVPFGEYVPFEQMLRDLIPFFNLPMSNFTPGNSNQQPLVAQQARFAPFICYEIVYPELVRKLGKDSDYLITVSNDAWFGDSWGPYQHFEIARMRALELGKYLIRGTNTGITAIIDHQGRVREKIPQFIETVLEGSIHPTEGHTPYSYIGWWPILGLCWLSVAGILISHRRVKNPVHH